MLKLTILYLGAIDSNIYVAAYVRAAVNKSRKAIGMLRLLSKYLSRNTSNELYMLYARPHLIYGEII